ncbi:MAG: hypothetical protein B7Y56_14120 [Gallionellales bacterium 35-53-114]|jgi:uncharacterized protein (TIGR02001 family)|nr:MAG: hypothetical protein B7Y56_14120 [Gallionellales bacterium 35-53-114]OYZ62342.1 MAG: hypothetical protein B7Y04_14370 [Gallionellales bacterium 24-53-125]OZB07382.1 MAG: hypothetical protein B7X61_14790 [Gallionellales bacterium 39-52-133]HQS59555.1 TorF family putative porin [Gallionellaceae bacterium]HQS75542.1 TorF family putative porin [Gallionellaceae bacterium]
MQKSKLMVALLGALCAMPVMAADEPASPHTVTSNVGIVSNYVFRGITQTAGAPAIQGGMDYAHASGFYAGVWGSNVTWIADAGALASGSQSMELDTYLGYRSSITDDIGYDVGYVRFNYLGSSNVAAASGFASADTAEVYAALSYKFLTAKYSYSVLNQFLTVADEKGTNYIELNANYTIPDTSYTLSAHYGKQTYTSSTADPLYSYSDYKVGVAKDFSGYVVALAYTSTNAKETGYTYTNGGFWGKSATAISLTHAF